MTCPCCACREISFAFALGTTEHRGFSGRTLLTCCCCRKLCLIAGYRRPVAFRGAADVDVISQHQKLNNLKAKEESAANRGDQAARMLGNAGRMRTARQRRGPCSMLEGHESRHTFRTLLHILPPCWRS
jgi:hypothetical protein